MGLLIWKNRVYKSPKLADCVGHTNHFYPLNFERRCAAAQFRPFTGLPARLAFTFRLTDVSMSLDMWSG